MNFGGIDSKLELPSDTPIALDSSSSSDSWNTLLKSSYTNKPVYQHIH